MIYLIIGRTGAGKDHLAHLMEQQGMKILKSYTTRPKRTETEDTHIFITKEEAKNYQHRVAETVINNHEYFATKDQIADCDIYIIDPKGMAELTSKLADEDFHIIHITADKETRKKRAAKRGDLATENKIFEEREASEDQQFSDFEELIQLRKTHQNQPLPNNIARIYTITNNGPEEILIDAAEKLANEKMLHDKITKIVKECQEQNIIYTDPAVPEHILLYRPDGAIQSLTPEQFTEVVIDDTEGFTHLMKQYIMKSDKL